MSIFIEDLKYLTIAEYKSSSSSDLVSKTDDEIQIQIWFAEKYVSDFINEDLLEKDIDWNLIIPLAIKQATSLITDCLYSESLKVVKDKEIIEEKDENHTRKYQINENKGCMSDKILLLLKPYKDKNKVSGIIKSKTYII